MKWKGKVTIMPSMFQPVQEQVVNTKEKFRLFEGMWCLVDVIMFAGSVWSGDAGLGRNVQKSF